MFTQPLAIDSFGYFIEAGAAARVRSLVPWLRRFDRPHAVVAQPSGESLVHQPSGRRLSSRLAARLTLPPFSACTG